jgi:hypothetical protein
MRCPACHGRGSLAVAEPVPFASRRHSATVECPLCRGAEEVGGADGLPDDDGELPIGWSPPLHQTWSRWTAA